MVGPAYQGQADWLQTEICLDLVAIDEAQLPVDADRARAEEVDWGAASGLVASGTRSAMVGEAVPVATQAGDQAVVPELVCCEQAVAVRLGS